jgi:hypothetical protein
MPFSLCDFAFLFRVPTMRKLHIHTMAEREMEHLELSPRSSNIVDLGIHTTNISLAGLMQAISSCRNLIHFTFVDVREEGFFEDLPTFSQTLGRHHRTLETLEWRNRSPNVKAPCSLEDFCNLREIDCDAWVFDNADSGRPLSSFMPPRIRRIHIHSTYPSFLQNFLGVKVIHADLVGLNGKGGRLGELAKVRLTLLYGLDSGAHEMAPYSSDEGGVDFAVEDMYGSCVCWGWS